MEDKKSFGEYVCKKRKELGLTQKEFAEKLFVTESAVSKWERGLSYPDITLVSNMCSILGISERELLNAREDVESNDSAGIAKKFLRIITRYRIILSVLYGISLLVCFICNIAISHTLTWFFIVLTSEMVAASLTLVPVAVKEKKGLKTLGTFMISLSLLFIVCNIYTEGNWFLLAFLSVLFGMTLLFLPYILNIIWLPEYFKNKKTLLYFITETLLLFILLYTCNLYTGGNWFFKTAMPIALYALLWPWGMMLIIRYTSLSKIYKTTACLALTCIFHFTIQGVISYILKNGQFSFGFQFDFLNWREDMISGNINMIIFMVLLMVTVFWGLWGTYDQAGKIKQPKA